jgi:hypothetical protein
MPDTGRVTFTKALPDGRTATVTVKAISHLHSASSTLAVDGQVVTEHLGPYHAVNRLTAASRPELVAQLGPLGFNAEEAAQVKAAWQEIADTTGPDWDLQRQQLVAAVNGAEQEAGAGAAGRFDNGHPDPWDGPEARREKQALDGAIAALAAFDREHPEAAARAAAERDKAVQRALEGRD